ncbi:MAG: PAS domain-containing protein, partial [Candidatus Cloacimonetes bacterium]|nr:PAS domain-containing protein [Candidatus Cloacimonadota bacterium]
MTDTTKIKDKKAFSFSLLSFLLTTTTLIVVMLAVISLIIHRSQRVIDEQEQLNINQNRIIIETLFKANQKNLEDDLHRAYIRLIDNEIFDEQNTMKIMNSILSDNDVISFDFLLIKFIQGKDVFVSDFFVDVSDELIQSIDKPPLLGNQWKIFTINNEVALMLGQPLSDSATGQQNAVLYGGILLRNNSIFLNSITKDSQSTAHGLFVNNLLIAADTSSEYLLDALRNHFENKSASGYLVNTQSLLSDDPTDNLELVSLISTKSLYAHYSNLLFDILFIFLLICVTVIITHLVYRKLIVSPVRKLMNYARKVADESPEALFTPCYIKQFNQLGKVLTAMVDTLIERRLKIEMIIEASGFDFWEMNYESGDRIGSDRIFKALGHSSEKIPSKISQIFEIMHPDDVPTMKQKLEEHFMGKTNNFYCEFRILDKNNEWIWIADYGKAVKHDQEGNIIKLVGMSDNIHERKTAEATLLEEKEKLSVTLHSIGDGVITTDTEGRVQIINSVAEELTGWTQAEARGHLITEVFVIIDESNRNVSSNPVEKVLETGKIQSLSNSTLLISRDKKERAIADSGAPIMNSQNEIIGVVLVFR